MIGDMLIVDAVVHPYNLAIDNQDPAAKAQLETVYAAYCLSSDAGHAEYALTHEEFFSESVEVSKLRRALWTPDRMRSA